MKKGKREPRAGDDLRTSSPPRATCQQLRIAVRRFGRFFACGSGPGVLGRVASACSASATPPQPA